MKKCPISLERIADYVNEIQLSYERDNYNSEYGISINDWLNDHYHYTKAVEMADKWWETLSEKDQKEWIVRHKNEILSEIERLQSITEYLSNLI